MRPCVICARPVTGPKRRMRVCSTTCAERAAHDLARERMGVRTVEPICVMLTSKGAA